MGKPDIVINSFGVEHSNKPVSYPDLSWPPDLPRLESTQPNPGTLDSFDKKSLHSNQKAIAFIPIHAGQYTTYLGRGAASDVWLVSQEPSGSSPMYVSTMLRVTSKNFDHWTTTYTEGDISDNMTWLDFVKNYESRVSEWTPLAHENVIRVYDNREDLNLHVEFCSNGTVRDIGDVLAGLVYLHSQDPPVVHGSLNAGKIFVDEHGRAKVGEFGLAALCYPMAPFVPSVMLAGFSRWMSPELLDIDPDTDDPVLPTIASDTWALGCTIFEIVTGQLPYQKHTHDVSIQQAIINGEKPDLRGSIFEKQYGGEFCSTIESCWSKNSFERPHVSQIHAQLLLALERPSEGYGNSATQYQKELATTYEHTDPDRVEMTDTLKQLLGGDYVGRRQQSPDALNRFTYSGSDFDPEVGLDLMSRARTQTAVAWECGSGNGENCCSTRALREGVNTGLWKCCAEGTSGGNARCCAAVVALPCQRPHVSSTSEASMREVGWDLRRRLLYPILRKAGIGSPGQSRAWTFFHRPAPPLREHLSIGLLAAANSACLSVSHSLDQPQPQPRRYTQSLSTVIQPIRAPRPLSRSPVGALPRPPLGPPPPPSIGPLVRDVSAGSRLPPPPCERVGTEPNVSFSSPCAAPTPTQTIQHHSSQESGASSSTAEHGRSTSLQKYPMRYLDFGVKEEDAEDEDEDEVGRPYSSFQRSQSLPDLGRSQSDDTTREDFSFP